MDFRTLQVVWVALMFGVAAYTAVVYCLLTFGVIEMGLLPTSVLPLAAAAAFAIMAAGTVLRRRMVEGIGPGAEPEARLRQYATATILGLAMIEGGSLLLVTLSLIVGAPTWAVVGGGAGIGMMVLSAPNRGDAGLGR